MKQRCSYNSKQAGFTLIDLMIAVAIIGILATIAMQKFEHFAQKARQAEAKTNLAGLYMAEKAFYADWGGYTGDFRDIGFTLTGSRMIYDYGFATSGWTPAASTFLPSAAGGCASGSASNTNSPCAVDAGGAVAPHSFAPAAANGSCGSGQDPTSLHFRATANGSLGAGSPDVWTMDETNLLCNNQTGLASSSSTASAAAASSTASAAASSSACDPTISICTASATTTQ